MNLTLIGRIYMVKTLGLAKHVYSTSLSTISKPLIDSIAFEVLERALKIAAIKRIIEGGDHASWETILNWVVRQFGCVDF